MNILGKSAAVLLVALTVNGCAERASAIAPAVVPTANYSGYDLSLIHI